MAIKGKRKKSRSAAAKRRPAAAPRPVPGARRKPPWYRTVGGRISLAIGALITIIVIALLVTNARDEAADLSRRQDALESYTAKVRGVLQTLREPVAGLSGAVADPASLDADKAGALLEALTKAQGQLSTAVPPPGAETAGRVYTEAIALYGEAGQALAAAAEADGATREALLARVQPLLARAESLWLIATSDLDTARTEAELDASAIAAPSSLPPAPVATPSPEHDDSGRAEDDEHDDDANSGRKGDSSKRDRGSDKDGDD